MEAECDGVSVSESVWPPRTASDDEWCAWASAWPSIAALGMVCRRFDEDAVEFDFDDVPFPTNANGAFNGGILAAVADQVFGALALRNSPDFVPATANLQVEFHRPLVGRALVRGRALPGGRRLQFLEAVFTDEQGHRCVSAHATMVAIASRAPSGRGVDATGSNQ